MSSPSTAPCCSSDVAPSTRSGCGSRSTPSCSTAGTASSASGRCLRAGSCGRGSVSVTSWRCRPDVRPPSGFAYGSAPRSLAPRMRRGRHRRDRGRPGTYPSSAALGRRLNPPPSSSGPGRRPFKAEARVRIPLGARDRRFGVDAQPNTRLWGSPESPPPCQGGDRGIEARQARWAGRPTRPGSSVGRARG